jgi:glycosyltransferase involved in cell wall biosynthesis
MPAEIDASPPQFSIIIPIYNDWDLLEGCLQSLAQQTQAPSFEVIVVDDGSQKSAPEWVRSFNSRVRLTMSRQQHTGIAAARNCGVQNSKGTILLFTDADCRLDSNCLSVLNHQISNSPQHKYFQLRLIGDPSSLTGRAEQLRLLVIQSRALLPDGRIRYLNTSGFALRRSDIHEKGYLFDPAAQRSEDTLFLTALMQKGDLPLYVDRAVVRHTIQMSLAECICKDVRVAWLEAKTFERIAAIGVQVRMSNRERIAVLRSTWKMSRQASIGRVAWFVLTARQGLQRLISVLYPYLPFRSDRKRG